MPKYIEAFEKLDEIGEDIFTMGSRSTVPACCEADCEVEPDGHCPHGHPSVLLDVGII